ncbi:MAG: hypothetical protein U1F83_08145 [Verrucomicrobiota bacterium]
MTNREFYKGIESLLKERRDENSLSLEQYLISLWFRVSQHKTGSGLSPSVFYKLLVDSFAPVEAKIEKESIDEAANGFAGWDSLIRRQVNDLRAMKANGQLQDEQRYFGVDSPSGQRWYNFDPCCYIECATVGSLGGWEEGDETGREYVPGQVAALNHKGEIFSVDPKVIDRTPVEMASLSWDQLKDFLWCGQHYE